MSRFARYQDHKKSELKWLPSLPSHWRLGPLKHFIKFQVGGTPATSKPEYFDGDLPWVTISDLSGKTVSETKSKLTNAGVNSASMELMPTGSLLYSFKLSVGQVAFSERSTYTNEAIASFPPQKNAVLDYFYYNLPISVINNAATNIYGASILNQELIKNASIPCPPLE